MRSTEIRTQLQYELQRGRKIIAEARQWIGTPFHYGQACKGVGCDCTGLIIGVYAAIGIADLRYLAIEQPQVPSSSYVRTRILKAFSLVGGMEPAVVGDVLLFEVAGTEQHVAIYSASGCMIHSLQNVNAVTEIEISQGWSRRCSGVFRLREAE